MSPIAVQFGAGNIGRGFIGALLANSGYEVVFVDVVEPVINALNDKNEYDIEILDLGKTTETIKGVRGVKSGSEEMIEAVKNASIVTTAVGPGILKFVAPNIAKGIIERRKSGKTPANLNVIACENLVGNSKKLREEIEKNITDEEDKRFLEEHVGFPNCSVDRIVPPFKGENVLDVGVERFFEWIVEEPLLKGIPEPKIEGMILTDNLTAYVQRKLFTLNCGHAITAYLGYLKGYATIDKAIADPEIRDVAVGAMSESGKALCKRHGFNTEEHEKYITKIETRFKNPYVNDDCTRVGREPLRKLAKTDRLVGPVNMDVEYDIPHPNLLKGVAAALLYNNSEDPQSKDLQAKIADKGIEEVITEVVGFEKDSSDFKTILSNYNDLKASSKKD